ncbi:hypothetical protein NS220_06000 [Microbacterium testaceum]|uniref:Uncharacterized protein n=1 Tax=Microbacterium testaceum TaxID=2033 RepID=A0A147EYJ4_MICTE|nr:hypothetical protein [Microbacterium testaceum]KTR95356.1 hypothetical protein NS220_06000 [Microbacterium testaceum]
MNRYAAAGINGDALKGKRIIVITRDGKASREALEQIAQAAPLGVDITVRRANGAERISYPTTGGEVFIRSYRQGARGVSADILYLDDAVDALVRSTDAWTSLYASVATSQHAEVIRA